MPSSILKATCKSISMPNYNPRWLRYFRSVGDLDTHEIDDYLNLCEKALARPANWNTGKYKSNTSVKHAK